MIAPEKAKELLDSATPGPWELNWEETSEHDDLVQGLCAWLEAGHERVFGAGLVIEDQEELTNLALAAAAPDLAETIASMLWEYAVQVEIRPGVWRYLSHGETVTQLSHKAKWFTTPGDACRYAKDRGWPEHTVRRLVSDPEVIK